MAKKSQDRKNSRAARRLLDEEPELDIGETAPSLDEATDPKTRVLNQLAEKQKRENPSAPESIEDELLAISKGNHPDQAPNVRGRVSKQGKKSKKDKKKQQRAEMLKDMLSEKITLAKQRHKTIRGYRKKDDEDE